MNPEIIGLTISMIGKVMVAYTAIKVHFRVWKEHSIDERVFTEMKKEQWIGIFGIILIIIGYIFEVTQVT
jgi:rRNA processing protein Gar1